jgi:hypothetical protein
MYENQWYFGILEAKKYRYFARNRLPIRDLALARGYSALSDCSLLNTPTLRACLKKNKKTFIVERN